MSDRLENTHLAQVRAQYILGDDLFDTRPPPSNEDALDVLSSDEAEVLLRSGEPLRRKRIIGDLVLGQQDLKNPFEFDLGDGQRGVLAGLPQPEFTRKPWPHKIELEECFVTGTVIFAGLWLQDSISISSTTFNSKVDFQFCQFDKSAAFHNCRFQARAGFVDTVFTRGAHFNRTSFLDVCDFYHTRVLDGASFDNAFFQSESIFSESTFDSTGPFPPCFSFRHCVCLEAAHFENVNFEKPADFTDTQFRRQVDFRRASFVSVSFANTDFHRLELKWEQIAAGKLLFAPVLLEGLEPSRPMIEARELEGFYNRRVDAPLHEKHRQYDILKAIFTKQGDYVSADGCYYEWKQVERRHSPLGLNPENWIVKAFHYLNWLSCGYGAKPIRTLFFGISLVLLFAVAYSLVDFNAGHLASGALPTAPELLTAWLKNLEFSFRTFMSFGAIENSRGLLIRLLFLVERLLGWLTLFLFVTTYTRIMLR